MCINIHNILVSLIYIRWIGDASSVVCLSGPPSDILKYVIFTFTYMYSHLAYGQPRDVLKGVKI